MTRLDENRAKAQLAQKASVDVTAVTQPDDLGQSLVDAVSRFLQRENQRQERRPSHRRRSMAEGNFIPTVQQRGAAIIKARGSSTAASAANAVVDTVRTLTTKHEAGDWHSVAVCSDGSYGIEKGLISSFPIRTNGEKWEIVQDVPLNDFSRSKIDATVAELKEEKVLVENLIS